jgi:RNA polymerase sigma factor (sigma-70 family)
VSDENRKFRRRYRPKVEALEALRLLSDGLVPLVSPSVVDSQTFPQNHLPLDFAPVASDAAWDTALEQTRFDDLFGSATSTLAPANPADVADGLGQLNRYLGRAWSRAGLSSQVHDDCTQAVYATLLQNLGRDGFENLAADIGHNGIRDVLSRETPDGPDFFRAVDMVKKRAQRERNYQTLDEGADVAGTDGATADWRGALHEAIAKNLNPREASLINDTLQGKTPAEIAQDWGVAPKTVSNEKTRALAKLREALSSDLTD